MHRNYGIPKHLDRFPRSPIVRDFSDIAHWFGVRILHVAKWVFILAMVLAAAGLMSGCTLPDTYYEQRNPGFSKMSNYEKARIRESNRARGAAWVGSWNNSSSGFRHEQFKHGLSGGQRFGAF